MAAVPILRNFHDIERELLGAPPVLTAEQIAFIQSPAFTRSAQWARLRYDFLRDHEAVCQCCGRGAADRRKINVDHIHPRRSHPQFALTYANLQVLCSTCNQGKGNRDRTDWRYRQQRPPKSQQPDIPPCPLCQAPMQLRSGSRRPPFWGCTRFPDCRGTRSAAQRRRKIKPHKSRLRTRSFRHPAPGRVRTTGRHE